MFNNNDNNNKKMPEILNDNNVLKQVIFFGFYLVLYSARFQLGIWQLPPNFRRESAR